MRSEVNMNCMLMLDSVFLTIVRVFLGWDNPGRGLLCAVEPDECWACSGASHTLAPHPPPYQRAIPAAFVSH